MTPINSGLASSAATNPKMGFRSLCGRLHCWFVGRLLGHAEVMSGVDQCDMRQRLREIAGLTRHTGIELLRQQAEIVRDRDHALEQRLRLGGLTGQYVGVGKPKAAGEKRAFDRPTLLRNLAWVGPQYKPA